MDFTLSATERRFQLELREWLEANPAAARAADPAADFAYRRALQRRMHEAGWVGIHWPREYGGRGADTVEQAIYFEELGRARYPRVANAIAIEMGGPTIIAHGTAAQKARYLPPILSAEEIWCQAFSEPDAGSDLAAIRTSARKVAGGWEVHGQKVWTSLAHEARRCLLLARTDADAPAHRGLTYFLLDMGQDGVQTRPIVQLTGEREFNEVFLDGAFVADGDVLGDVGGGWRVALTTLMNERAGIALTTQIEVRSALDDLVAAARERGWDADPAVRDRLARLHVDVEGLRLLTYRGLADAVRGPQGSLAKLRYAAVNQAIAELALELAGPDGLRPDSPVAHAYLRSLANSIEGGTTEVLRDIVAERVLGLPRSR